MALSLLYPAFVWVLQLLRLFGNDEEPVIEVVMLRQR
jgi:hypothetical protein